MDAIDRLVIKSVTCVVLALILFLASNCGYTKYTIRGMVEDGVDPILASCALMERHSSAFWLIWG